MHLSTGRLASVCIATILALGSASVPSIAQGQAGTKPAHPKLDTALRRVVDDGASELQRVIITTTPGRRDALKADLDAHGALVTGDLASVAALSAVVDGADLTALAQLPDVRAISLDGVIAAHGGDQRGKKSKTTTSGSDTSTTTVASDGGTFATLLGENHLRTTLGLDTEPFDGQGLKVAVVDSGIALTSDTHVNHVWGLYDFTGGKRPGVNQWRASFDDYGHGTHVAGLIAAAGWSSQGLYRGLAPETTLVAV